MSNWLSRILGSTPPATSPRKAPEPLAPYELLAEHGPPIGVRLERPLVYAFEHRVLPQAFFQEHPELVAALRPQQSAGRDFLHMWSKSGTLCCSVDGWQLESDEEIDAFWQYARPLMDSVVCEARIGTPYSVWTIRTPTPKTLGETYFIGLCSIDDGKSRPKPARCFTLEASVIEGTACFCEWTGDGNHINYGEMPLQTSDSFTQAVLQRIAQSGPNLA
jgi:hypothetical protein